MSITVDTECTHCGTPMRLDIDANMNCRSADKSCRPIIFVPDVNFRKLKDPHIIDAF